MHRAVWGILAVALALPAGCTLRDENPDWSPAADYPPWAFDAPVYYRPTEELPVAETLDGGIEVYYTSRDYFFVRHPQDYQLDGVPRVAVWLSTDDGGRWRRVGYFGVEQTHFLLRAEDDGPHWIRFVGPGQGTADVPPGRPQRVYVVDRKPPEATVTVAPPPRDEDGEVRPYEVQQSVTVSWSVSDANFRPGTVRIGMARAAFPDAVVWREFSEPLPASGTLRVSLPTDAAEEGPMRFHLAAEDKAGNVGVAVTEVMHVQKPTAVAEPQARAAELPPREPSPPALADAQEPGSPSPEAVGPERSGVHARAARAGRGGCDADGPGIDPEVELTVWEELAAPADRPPAGREAPPAPAHSADPPAGPVLGRFEPVGDRRPARLGWPQRGGLLRGGTLRVLRWLPTRAARYETVDLRFSATDGRTWQTLAENVQPGLAIYWLVPPVSGRHCRLQLLARNGGGEGVSVAVSEPFQVHTPGAADRPAPDAD